MISKSAEIDQLAAALVKIQAEVGKIPKDATNPFFKSKYADLPAVVDKAGPIVTKHGVAVMQLPGADELTTIVMHESGQWIGERMTLHLVKDDPQAQGSAITYARRYAYMAALGLVADEDDDGNRASMPAKQQQVQKPRHAPPVARTRPSPITEEQAVAKLETAFGASRDIVPENQFQRVIYSKARSVGLSGDQLNDLCVASVGCSFAEVDSPEKSNTIMGALQAQRESA